MVLPFGAHRSQMRNATVLLPDWCYLTHDFFERSVIDRRAVCASRFEHGTVIGWRGPKKWRWVPVALGPVGHQVELPVEPCDVHQDVHDVADTASVCDGGLADACLNGVLVAAVL